MPASTLEERKLDFNELSSLYSSNGLCLTVYLPLNRPGDPGSANPTRINANWLNFRGSSPGEDLSPFSASPRGSRCTGWTRSPRKGAC